MYNVLSFFCFNMLAAFLPSVRTHSVFECARFGISLYLGVREPALALILQKPPPFLQTDCDKVKAHSSSGKLARGKAEDRQMKKLCAPRRKDHCYRYQV